MRNIDEDRLVHYFASELTEEEALRVAAWIREDPARQARVESLRQIWEAAGQPRPSRFDTDAMWSRLADRMEPARKRRRNRRPRAAGDALAKTQMPAEKQTSVRERAHKRPARRRRLFGKRPARVAVATVLLVAAVFLAVAVFEAAPAEKSGGPAMREIATEAGQRARVRLSDGTQVVLNAKSTLRLPPAFAEDAREVRLEGEAYFEVASDAERPFLVRASDVTTRVLGTAFDVDAYPGDEDVQVVVAEGRVAVHAEQRASEAHPAQRHASEGLVLTPRQMGRLPKAGGAEVRRDVDVSAYLAWTEGRLVFKDASFEDVARKLAQWYDLRVRLADSSMTVDRLNAAFEDESISEILDVIAKTLGLRYEREGKTVTFFRAEPRSP